MGNNIGVGFEKYENRNAKNDFQGGASLLEHFGDHGRDFGFATQGQYLQGARYFFSKPPTPTMQSFISRDGWFFQFDTATNEFGIINKYGGISTYYIPDTGMDHWLEQIKKYAPK